MFSTMIQSGKDIFVDNKTSLTIYSFAPISGCLVLGLAQCGRWAEVEYNKM